jgi:hypothetical protein
MIRLMVCKFVGINFYSREEVDTLIIVDVDNIHSIRNSNFNYVVEYHIFTSSHITLLRFLDPG